MRLLLYVIEDVSGVIVFRATTASNTDMINQFFEPPRPKNIAYEREIHRFLKDGAPISECKNCSSITIAVSILENV